MLIEWKSFFSFLIRVKFVGDFPEALPAQFTRRGGRKLSELPSLGASWMRCFRKLKMRETPFIDICPDLVKLLKRVTPLPAACLAPTARRSVRAWGNAPGLWRPKHQR